MITSKASLRKIWRMQHLQGIDFLTAHNLSASRTAYHMHHGFTISLVEEGVLPICFLEFTLELKPGDFLMLGPDVVHSFNYSLIVPNCCYRTVFLKDGYLSPELKKKIAGETSTISCFSNSLLWNEYLNVQRGVEAGSQLDVSNIIKSSENLLSRMPDFALSRMEVKSSHILTVKEYLKKNFTSVPNIEELAEIAHISPFYLMHLFKEELGISPHAYINQLRVNKAKEMIEEGFPLLQITYELGFTDQSHFSKTFLKITGVNPVYYGAFTS